MMIFCSKLLQHLWHSKNFAVQILNHYSLRIPLTLVISVPSSGACQEGTLLIGSPRKGVSREEQKADVRKANKRGARSPHPRIRVAPTVMVLLMNLSNLANLRPPTHSGTLPNFEIVVF